jgi:hypothetical protein
MSVTTSYFKGKKAIVVQFSFLDVAAWCAVDVDESSERCMELKGRAGQLATTCERVKIFSWCRFKLYYWKGKHPISLKMTPIRSKLKGNVLHSQSRELVSNVYRWRRGNLVSELLLILKQSRKRVAEATSVLERSLRRTALQYWIWHISLIFIASQSEDKGITGHL